MKTCQALALASGLLCGALFGSAANAAPLPAQPAPIAASNVELAQHRHYHPPRHYRRHHHHRRYAPRCWNQRVVVRDRFGRPHARIVRRCR